MAVARSLAAFVRIGTHRRAWDRPLDTDTAVGPVREWLAAPAAWTPEPGTGHAEILLGLLTKHQITGALVTDAQLAALALEYGLDVYSADSDFAHFTGDVGKSCRARLNLLRLSVEEQVASSSRHR